MTTLEQAWQEGFAAGRREPFSSPVPGNPYGPGDKIESAGEGKGAQDVDSVGPRPTSGADVVQAEGSVGG